MKWYNEILTAVKSFFTLEHDATEQEVHDKLTSMKNMEALRQQIEADVRTTIEQEEAERYGAQIKAEADRADAAETRANDLEQQLKDVGATTDGLQSMINQLRLDAEALRARITELEALPGAQHTGGHGDDAGSGKPYMNNPLFLKAQKIKGTRT